MNNLLGIKDPYLHNSPRTFNRMATSLDVAGIKKGQYDKGVSFFDKLKIEAEAKEQVFFSYFNEKNAKDWSDKHLARIGENAEPWQQVLSAWNSDKVKKMLGAKDSRENIIKKLNDFFSKKEIEELINELDLEETLKQAFSNLENSQYSISNFLADLLIGKSKDTKTLQHRIREEWSVAGKEKRVLSSRNSAILKKLEKEIIKGKGNKTTQKKEIYDAFLFRLSEITKEDKLTLENSETYKRYLEAIKEILDDAEEGKNKIFSENLSVAIGAVAEEGEGKILSIPLEMEFGRLGEENGKNSENNIGIWAVGARKIKRLANNQKVDPKTDMIMTFSDKEKEAIQKFRFQQKNTNKDIFAEFEKWGEELVFQNKNAFFGVGSTIKYSTFIDQVREITSKDFSMVDDDLLSILSYLIVNTNVLNQGEGKNKLYKQDNINRTGLLLNQVNDTISRIVANAALLFFSDFEREGEKLIKTTYDFIIFDSRILIPMSSVYEGISESLKNYKKELKESSSFLRVRTSLKKTIDMDALAERKRVAVGGGFNPKGNYCSELLKEGKSAGKNMVEWITVNGVDLNIDIIPYIDKNLLALVNNNS